MRRIGSMRRDFERARERPAYTIKADAAVEPELTREDWQDLRRGAELFNGAPIDGLIKENQTDLDLTPFEVTAQDFQKALETMGGSGSRTLSQMRP